MKKGKAVMLVVTLCVVLLSACQSGTTNKMAADDGPLPAAPDYQDTSQWYITDRQAAADVFYIISTETGDYCTADGQVCHYADTYRDSLRAPLYGEMLGVDTLVSGRLNYFSPYYRQCSLQCFDNDSLAAIRITVPLDDVRRAFQYYLRHLNKGRPFILAGFSQGAHLMLELLKELDDSDYQRMIAAYAIGIVVSREECEVKDGKRIVAARGADDTGVTICYNSVRDTNCAMDGWQQGSIAINPVNWRTDSTAAILITEPTPWLPVAEQKKDTMTVRLDTATGLLIVEGYTATDYMLPLYGKEGNYHTREVWLYRDQLKENMALRASRFLRE